MKLLLLLLLCCSFSDALPPAKKRNGPKERSFSSSLLGTNQPIQAAPKNDTPSNNNDEDLSSSASSSARRKPPPKSVLVPPPRRRLAPPFPNGPCGGTIVSLPPEETFAIDTHLATSLLLPRREIRVWLPPNYNDNGGKRHKVLYVHDGQNALDDQESWTGHSWRLAGALTRLQDHGILVDDDLPLVVLLPSADDDILFARRRHLEYGDLSLPFAQAHADFVARTVKPVIDAVFSTYTSPQDTFAMGSSLGGQASFNLLLRHGNLFGGAACLSPAFGPTMFRELGDPERARRLLQGKRIYLDMGGDVNDQRVALLDLMDHTTTKHWWNPGYFWLDTQLQTTYRQVCRLLEAAGVAHARMEFAGARHNERAWAQRIHKPLEYLYGKR